MSHAVSTASWRHRSAKKIVLSSVIEKGENVGAKISKACFKTEDSEFLMWAFNIVF